MAPNGRSLDAETNGLMSSPARLDLDQFCTVQFGVILFQINSLECVQAQQAMRRNAFQRHPESFKPTLDGQARSDR